uniref:Uncharacterized protein n=1 Tax=viral metagenome TaxID=1070528 RepID=A0A6C0KT49_9ZZZZ
MNFIRLSNRIINLSYISSIIIKENRYTIKMLHFDMSGVMLFASGSLSTDSDIHICRKKDPQDYGVMSNWINQQTKQSK